MLDGRVPAVTDRWWWWWWRALVLLLRLLLTGSSFGSDLISGMRATRVMGAVTRIKTKCWMLKSTRSDAWRDADDGWVVLNLGSKKSLNQTRPDRGSNSQKLTATSSGSWNELNSLQRQKWDRVRRVQKLVCFYSTHFSVEGLKETKVIHTDYKFISRKKWW